MIAFVAVLLAASAWLALAAPTRSSASLGRVVALGDSSASGDGLGTKYDGSPSQCERTPNGYPALAVAQVTHSAFVNQTCAGATTSSLFYGSTGIDNTPIPAQLSALDGSERVVTLSVGDNDAAFGEVTSVCLAHWNPDTNSQLTGDACTQRYVQSGVNTLIARAQSIASNIGASLDAIHTRAPRAKVFLVGYPDLAPTSVAGCSFGTIYLTQNDAPVFNAWEETVDATLKSEAAQHNAYFVDSYSSAIGHDPCAGAARWVNPYNLSPGEGIPIHPNAAGAAAVSSLLLSAMAGAGVTFGPEIDVVPISFARIHRAKRGATFTRSAPAKGGGALTLALDNPADVFFKLDRVTIGRLAHGACRVKTRRNAKRARCTRYKSIGSWWKSALPAGTTAVYVTGRAAGRALPSGSYRVRIRSSDLPVSGPTTAKFQIVR